MEGTETNICLIIIALSNGSEWLESGTNILHMGPFFVNDFLNNFASCGLRLNLPKTMIPTVQVIRAL